MEKNDKNSLSFTAKNELKSEEARSEELKKEAQRIADQILTLTRNGLFVSLRFMDLALCQFEYVPTDSVRTISTTGRHVLYNSQYVISSYMKDRQSLFRDYLHMTLHCIFRHPFVSVNLNEEYWNIAADIAVETIIDELGLKQTETHNHLDVSEEISEIRKMLKHITAEHLYQMMIAGKVPQKKIALWKKLFVRDNHNIWWKLAQQIADELKRKQEEESKDASESDENEEFRDDEDAALDEDEQLDDGSPQDDDSESSEGDDDSDKSDTDETGENTDEENGEDIAEDSEESEENDAENESDEDSEAEESEVDEEASEKSDEDSEENLQDDSKDGEEGSEKESEEDYEQDSYEEEYSSTPGQSLQRENEDDVADPNSGSKDTGNESRDDGTGGGRPDEDNPKQSDEDGFSRQNDQTGENLDGSDDGHKPDGKNNSADKLNGTADEGRIDENQYDDPFADTQHQNSGAVSDGGSSNKSDGKQDQHGQHTAGSGGGGDGKQSAWQHDSGGVSRRGDGERTDEGARKLDGDVDPGSDSQSMSGDTGKQDAVAQEASDTAAEEKEKEPSFMHGSQDEQEALKEKWKDLSERILVDLQTSSKEWGERSDSMLQGVKKINRDKYDYGLFLKKFAAMREDIELNPDEFDYVYYTYGMQHYGNIPLVEPLEYREVKKVRDFVIAIDTSGSCAGEVVQKFLDKTYSMFTQQENFFRKINLHIIQCDAEIQSDVKITCRKEFDDYIRDLEFQGFGGTDFRPVFEYVNHLIEMREFDDLKGLIYFTDGNGTYPKRRPPYETAFVFVDDDEFEYEVPSWAMKLVLETSEIMEEVLI